MKILKRTLFIAGAALALAAPALALAPGNDTLTAVVAKGTVIKASIQGMDVELGMAYKADGTYAASMMGQAVGGGTFTVDGDKLCTKSDLGEGCTVYPAGKKAGDTFKITSPTLGEATVTINK
jgi:hypothetical protein